MKSLISAFGNFYMKKTIIVIGAGPAGLTSALLLAQEGHQVIIYESDAEYVGGLSRTVSHEGFRIDLGGHRFFSKDQEVINFWRQILKEDLLVKKRLSRIFFNNKYFKYPLKITDLVSKLNIFETIKILASYSLSQLFPPKEENNFENWMIKRFGKKLFNYFFKSYTEKIWGINSHEISSDWAAQRINNLNIKTLFLSFITQVAPSKKIQIKSLIDEFEYPRLGPGMMWEKVRDEFLKAGGCILMGQNVSKTKFDKASKKWTITTSSGETSVSADHLINSAPLAVFLQKMSPAPPDELLRELSLFSYRSFLTVAIMFKGDNPFIDHWIYIQDEKVKVARIQNYKNWSIEMVPRTSDVCLGLEYYCQEGDEFWSQTDQKLFELALKELEYLKIPFSKTELDYKVIRCNNAYPIYDLNYKARIGNIKNFINTHPTFHPVGRAGLHRYNNQDHSIKTAILTYKNIINNCKKYDPWNVNQDAEYIEETIT